MRATIADVMRHPTRTQIGSWWLDTPWKRPRNWWTLLFEPGRGWLRWGWDEYDYIEVVIPETGQGPREYVPCAPPLRRIAVPIITYLAWFARGGGWVKMPADLFYGEGERWERVPREHWGRVGFREAWTEARDPEWPYGYFLP